jgi:hypothetical protein
MNLIDKLLLGSLVILLPIGLILSQRFFEEEAAPQQQAESLDTAKLEELIKQTVAQSQPKIDKPASFQIASVTYASESGSLRVVGTAPETTSSVMVSAIVLPKATPAPSGQTQLVEKVQGTKVELESITPKPSKEFVYEYEISPGQLNGIIELRLEQNQSSTTLRFDLEQKKQVL